MAVGSSDHFPADELVCLLSKAATILIIGIDGMDGWLRTHARNKLLPFKLSTGANLGYSLGYILHATSNAGQEDCLAGSLRLDAEGHTKERLHMP